MSILSELQSKKLGLIELLSMGFDIFLKNIKLFLITYLTIIVPFLTLVDVFAAYITDNPLIIIDNPLIFLLFYLLFLIYLSIFYPALIVASSIITENFVLNKETNFKNVIQVVLSRLLTLINLNIRFGVNTSFRLLLLTIPGIIYSVNNGYYGLAFILRDQRGRATFAYSRSIVKGNWWKVFFLGFLNLFVILGVGRVFRKLFSFIPLVNSSTALMIVLPDILAGFIAVSTLVATTLLFLNLDYQKSLEN